MEGFYRQRGWENEISSKERTVPGLDHPPLWVLTRKFQSDPVKITFLGEPETVIRLAIKSWFADVGLAQVTPFWACHLFFLTMSTLQSSV